MKKKINNVFKVRNYNGLLYKQVSVGKGDRTIIILGVKEKINEVIIPEKIDNLSVTQIKKGAFKNNINITKFVCPSSIKSIGEYAFYGCSNLREVELSCNLKVIKKFCFYGCESLEKIKLPFELLKIEESAFENCINLKEMPHYLKTRVGKVKVLNKRYIEKHLPVKLNYIDKKAFKNCEKLSDIYIPYLVKDIKRETFKNCANLKNVYLHNNIKSIEQGAFKGCKSLRDITIPSSIEKLSRDASDINTKFIFTMEIDEKNKSKLNFDNVETLKLKDVKLDSKMIPGKYKKFYTEKDLENAVRQFEFRTCVDQVMDRKIDNYEIKQSRYKLNNDRYCYDDSTSKNKAKIIMTGDIMCRSLQIKQAYEDNSYDFSETFEDIKPVIEKSDLAIGNLETLTAYQIPYSTEKTYVDDMINLNAPPQFLNSIRNSGYDVLINSNNHIYDTGTKGIFETLDMQNKHQLMHTGVFASSYDKRYLSIEVNGINVAIISYCSQDFQQNKRSNFHDLGLKSLFSCFYEDDIKKDIENAKKDGAEFIIAYCHWGSEYTDKITFNQARFAKIVANCGADYILGSHPHCLQKYIRIKTDDGRVVPCLYSAGNFISDMEVKLPETRDTLMVELNLEKNKNGKIIITDEQYIPCLIRKNNKGKGQIKTFLIENLLNDESESKDVLYNDLSRIKRTIGRSDYFKMKIDDNSKEIVNELTLLGKERSSVKSKSKKKKKKSLKAKIKRYLKKIIYNYKRVITIGKICQICDIEIPKEFKKLKNKKVSNMVMSTRVLTPNSVLFTNTNSYNKEQLKQIKDNCICVITSKEIKGCPCIITDKPMIKGAEVFNYIKSLRKITTVAVTGSVGKSSTKEMIGKVLSQKYKNNMVVSQGNSNVIFRIASHIMKLKYSTKVFLQEVGIGMTNGNTRIMGRMLEADVIVYTNIRDSHIEGYGSRENIFKEKLALSEYGNKNGLVVINYDDPILKSHKYIQKAITYSLNNKDADCYAKDIFVKDGVTYFKIIDNIDGKMLEAEIPAVGEHNVLNAVVAYAVGKSLKVSPKLIATGIRKYKTSRERQNLIDFGKYKVLADCYNSSYDAIKSILQTMNLIEASGKKIAVIGDIFELGSLSSEIHKNVGKLLAESSLDKIIYYGDNVKDSYEEHLKLKKNAVYYSEKDKTIDEIKSAIDQGDLILFKASHGMRYSELIDSVFGSEIGEVTALYDKKNKEMEDDIFKYNVFDHTATAIELIGDNKVVTIPNKIEGRPIEKLSKDLFKDNKTVNEIKLNDSLLRIGKSCFENCNIEKVSFNKNLKVIAENAFNSCKNLKEVKLPEDLLVIEKSAFANCKNLKEVYISSQVQKIDNNAFLNSDNLTILCFKDSYAFKYAENNNIKFKLMD